MPSELTLRCKAFLFDLDGVLVDSRSVVERTWRRWAERHQIDPIPLLQVAHGRRARDTLRMVVPGLATDEEVAWLDATELGDREGLSVVPGVKELLTALPRDRWAIVTSCGRDLARLRLGSAGLPIPDVMIVAEEAKRGKPAPDGYLLGASGLGYDPGECVVFEDAPAGIAAARAAGARIVGLTTTHAAHELPGVDATIADFRDIEIRPDHDAFVVTIHDEGSWHSPHERRSFVSMTDDFKTKLQALLQAYATQAPKQQPADNASRDQADRRMCGERLHAVVRPVLEALMAELKSAGYEASVREHIERDDAYPSVALSFTPRNGLASALIFRFDPRHGIVVQREVKHAPWKGRPPTGTGDRLGTIGITAVSEAWVETKSLSFIEAVLKAN
jgi:sugar-phosphatase